MDLQTGVARLFGRSIHMLGHMLGIPWAGAACGLRVATGPLAGSLPGVTSHSIEYYTGI